MTETELAKSYEFSKSITLNHYENFPVASLLIPKHLRKHITAIYAFARIADDIVDEGNKPDNEKEKLLIEYKNKFLNNDLSYYPHFAAVKDSIEKYNIPVTMPLSLIDAFIQDTKKKTYEDFNELMNYCKNSANPIGRMVLRFFKHDDEWIDALSDNICSGLQLTNFLQDLRSDIKKSRCYLPLDEMKEFGISLEEIKELKYSDRFRKFMKFQVKRTKLIFGESEKIISLVDKSLKRELIMIINGGLKVLDKISHLDYNTLHYRPVLSKMDKLGLFSKIFTGNY